MEDQDPDDQALGGQMLWDDDGQPVCGALCGELGDGTPVYCIRSDGHSGLCAPLPEGL